MLHRFVGMCFMDILVSASWICWYVLHGFVGKCFMDSFVCASWIRWYLFHGFEGVYSQDLMVSACGFLLLVSFAYSKHHEMHLNINIG